MSEKSRDIYLVNELLNQEESEWLEFKRNMTDIEQIGRLCSALSNGAAVVGRDKGYLIWGVDDKTRRIVGTTFDPESDRAGNQDLRLWLGTMLSPRPSLAFRKINHPKGRLVLMEISTARGIPTAFKRVHFVRDGGNVQYLQENPQLFARLLNVLNSSAWEEAVVKEQLQEEQVLELLDWEKFLELKDVREPKSPVLTCQKLQEEKIVGRNDAGRWGITNLGAILFARDLSAFGAALEGKGIRALIYRGADKASTVRDEIEGKRGYAMDLIHVMERIYSHIPVSQRIDKLHRKDIPDFSESATREILVNAIIHQDFRATDAGPMLFLFGNRLEVCNPGKSLVPPEKMVGASPRSRNRMLADLTRRMGLCEMAGSGLVKVIKEVEAMKFPPPNFKVDEDETLVTLYGPRDFSDMTSEERLRACRQHAVIMDVRASIMTNATLRERLGLPSDNRGITHTSIIIRTALEKGLITHFDPDRPRAGYVPVGN